MASLSTAGTRNRHCPAASERAESTGPPSRIVTRCSTTQCPSRGVSAPPRRPPPPPPLPPRRNTPETDVSCAAIPAPPPRRKIRRARALRRELAEVLRIEILEVVLQRIGVERLRPGLGARQLGGVDRGILEQVVAGEDLRLA